METRTKGKGTIDRGLWGSMGTLDDMNPTRLSKQSQDCSLTLTSRIVSKPLMGLTTLNQALICTPTPNLMGVIRSESMISQAFQACYFIESCPSNCCVLVPERIGYMTENIHQLNLSPRSPLTHSRELHLQPQELLRWRQGPRRLSHQSPLWEIY